MDKKRMKRMIGIAIPRALIITGISYNGYIRTHTFTLSGGVVKNELIQPINNKIEPNLDWEDYLNLIDIGTKINVNNAVDLAFRIGFLAGKRGK